MEDRRAGLGVRLAAMALPIVLALVVAEVVVRASGLSSTNHRMIYEGGVVKGRPNSSYVNRSENRNVVRLNNVGFHDRDWDLDGSAYGILFLGDSMTEGIQVPVDSLFTSVLEDILRRGGAHVDVMNAAVSATGTGHQYLLWKTFVADCGVRVDRLVVCLFPQNDLKNNHVQIGKGPENFGVYLQEDGRPYVHRTGGTLRSLVRRATQYSALLNLIYTRLHFLAVADGPAEENGPAASEAARTGGSRHPDFASAGAESLWADSMQRTLRLIGRWSEEAADRRQAFSVVIIPSTDRNNFYENELSRRLLQRADEGEFEVLKLELGGRDLLETNSFDGETLGHLSFLGHRLAARELNGWLVPSLPETLWSSRPRSTGVDGGGG